MNEVIQDQEGRESPERKDGDGWCVMCVRVRGWGWGVHADVLAAS